MLVLASTYPRWRGDPEPGFVHELSRRLARRFEVTVLCPHAPGAAARETLDGVAVRRYRYAPAQLETLVNDGGILHNLRRTPWKWLLVPGFLLSQAWSTRRLLHELEPHAIHAHWLIPQGLIAAMFRKVAGRDVPLLVTSHGSDLHAMRGRVLSRLKAFAARRATALSVVSRSMVEPASWLGVPAGRIHVRPMGVDVKERFHPDRAVAREGRELLFVGRMVEKKGLHYLIEAMPAVLRAHPDATLTIVGFGPEEPEHRNRVAALGLQDKVRFAGPVDNAQLSAYYRRAALLVAPFLEAASGDREGLGLVVVEAMACGCPVLASNVDAVRDTVEHGVNGWLAPPASAPDLAAQIVQLLGDAALRARLAAKGLESVAKFDWTAAAAGYADLIDELSQAESSTLR